MGWGTFILGRALGPRQRRTNWGEELAHSRKQLASHLEYQTYIEDLVRARLEELPVEERQSKYREIRLEVMRIDKLLNDPNFHLKVARQASSLTLSGKKVDLKAIEQSEIKKALLARKRRLLILKESLIWLFVPYFQIWKIYRKFKKGKLPDTPQ